MVGVRPCGKLEGDANIVDGQSGVRRRKRTEGHPGSQEVCGALPQARGGCPARLKSGNKSFDSLSTQLTAPRRFRNSSGEISNLRPTRVHRVLIA